MDCSGRHNRLVVTYLGALAFCFLSPSPSVGEDEAPSPPLQFREAALDLGAVSVWDQSTFDVTVRNTSDTALAVSSAESTCGCVEPEVDSGVLEPGEETTVRVHLSLDGIGSSDVFARVFVNADDGASASDLLEVRGHIVPSVSLEKDRLDFGEVMMGTEKDAFIALERHAPFEVNVTKIEASDGVTLEPIFGKTVGEFASRKAPWEANSLKGFRVALSPDLPKGSYRGKAVVTTDKGPKLTHKILIHALILGPELSINPKVLVLGDVQPGVSGRPIRIEGEGALAVRVMDAGHPTVRFSVVEAKDNPNAVEVVPAFNADANAGRIHGTCRLAVSVDGIEEEHQVRYVGNITAMDLASHTNAETNE